jgi:KipI family sensor histidine kinase inhibitor
VKLVPFGERALRLELGGGLDQTLGAAAALREAFPELDVVLGAGALLLDGVAGVSSEAIVRVASGAPALDSSHRDHLIEVRYDGEDLDEVASASGLSRAEVIARHAASEFTVALLGFLPGFAYLEGLDPRLDMPRRGSPRPRVPSGAVAIAGPYSGVYPFASPGGWHLLGSAIDCAPFDPNRDPPASFSPGDRVRFRASDAPRPMAPIVAPRSAPTKPFLEIALAPAGATVQDGGRPMRLGQGLPPSGPLDRDAHAAANVAVGNDPSTAAIEVPLGALEVMAHGESRVAVDGRAALSLHDGERLRVEPEGRAVRYLSVRGGVDVPMILGARATLLVAKLGGLDGRGFKKGDAIGVGREPVTSERAPSRLATGPIRVVPGPDLDRFAPGAFERFVGSPWTVSPRSDRVGTRLEGARVERRDADAGAPSPMIRGAVQVTTDGTPIVLGPDHPTTGGYPVIAVVDPGSWSALARTLPRGPVRFVA